MMSHHTPRRLWVILCLALFATLIGVTVIAADIKPIRTVLPNGLTVVFVQQSSLPIVTVHALVKAGSIYDTDDTAGLSYLVAQMLDEGTTTRSATQIAQDIESVGGALSFQGGDDFVTGSLRVLKKDANLGFTLLADTLMHPAFADQEFERVRNQLIGGLKSEQDEPSIIADKAFDEMVFDGHPYRRPANGTEQTIGHLTRKNVLEFHSTYYHPNHTILAIVGDLHESDMLELVRKHFGAWTPQENARPKFPPAKPLQAPKLKLINKDLTQANIILGHVGIERNNPDFYATSVMNYILGGGGFSSRLVDRIRDAMGLAYDVNSGFDAKLMPGAFAIRLQTRNAVANQAITSVLQEVTRMRTEPVTNEELADAKAYLVGSFPLRLDTMDKLAGILTLIEFYNLGYTYFEDYPKAILAVTKDDVLRVAKKYLHPDAYALVVVAKQAEAKIKQSLKP